MMVRVCVFNDQATTEMYKGEDTLSLNDALPIYSSKGTVKQALREAGFNVKRLPGPPMKRHILRATKVC